MYEKEDISTVDMNGTHVIEMVDHMPHVTSEVICINCKMRWLGVRPEYVWLKDLECPQCHETGYVIETGQKITES